MGAKLRGYEQEHMDMRIRGLSEKKSTSRLGFTVHRIRIWIVARGPRMAGEDLAGDGASAAGVRWGRVGGGEARRAALRRRPEAAAPGGGGCLPWVDDVGDGARRLRQPGLGKTAERGGGHRRLGRRWRRGDAGAGGGDWARGARYGPRRAGRRGGVVMRSRGQVAARDSRRR